jgi:hypothetical protein
MIYMFILISAVNPVKATRRTQFILAFFTILW